MALTTRQSDKVRVQVDLSAAEASLLEVLQRRLAVRSRADLLQQAYGTFLWVLDEMLAGRHIVSIEKEGLDQLDKYKELSIPAVEPLLFEHYQYLAARPQTGRNQLYLKGRNMTVGQLVYKMRANDLSTEQAAADMNLPVLQVREAQAYYQTHRELIEAEMEEEKHYTPEAADFGETLLKPAARRVIVDSLDPGYQVMDADPGLRQIDLVTVGCPHASLSEIEQIAGMLQGQRLATQLWVTTARITRDRAREAGWVQAIEAAGGQVVADTCAVVAPMRSIGITTMATNAGKMACYAPAHSKVKMRYGSLEQCVEAAVTGTWSG